MKYIVVSTIMSTDNIKKQTEILNRQKPKPIKWYIYNDTMEENKEVKKKTKRARFKIRIIKDKRLKKKKMFYYKKAAHNLNKLFEIIIKEKVKTEYYLKLDDDTMIPNNYIESLEQAIRFENYGCVSGKIISRGQEEHRNNDYAIGTGMLIRKEIIDWLKGYPKQAGSDTVLNITARYLKMETRQLNSIELKQTRLTAETSGYTRAEGTAIKQYCLRYPATFIILHLYRNSKGRRLKSFRIVWNETRKVKESDKLNKKELIRLNKRRLNIQLVKEVWKKLRKVTRI